MSGGRWCCARRIDGRVYWVLAETGERSMAVWSEPTLSWRRVPPPRGVGPREDEFLSWCLIPLPRMEAQRESECPPCGRGHIEDLPGQQILPLRDEEGFL